MATPPQPPRVRADGDVVVLVLDGVERRMLPEDAGRMGYELIKAADTLLIGFELIRAARDVKLECGFALVDIKKGRYELLSALERGAKVRLTISGMLDGDASSVGPDDGMSREFSLLVDDIRVMWAE